MRAAACSSSNLHTPYFTTHLIPGVSSLHVGGPFAKCVSSRRHYVLSRRIESADGRFLGMIAASIDMVPRRGIEHDCVRNDDVKMNVNVKLWNARTSRGRPLRICALVRDVFDSGKAQMYAEDVYAVCALRLGAAAYLAKSSPADILITAMRKAAVGRICQPATRGETGEMVDGGMKTLRL